VCYCSSVSLCFVGLNVRFQAATTLVSQSACECTASNLRAFGQANHMVQEPLEASSFFSDMSSEDCELADPLMQMLTDGVNEQVWK
jgi:hypothetical protein